MSYGNAANYILKSRQMRHWSVQIMCSFCLLFNTDFMQVVTSQRVLVPITGGFSHFRRRCNRTASTEIARGIKGLGDEVDYYHASGCLSISYVHSIKYTARIVRA